MCPACMASAALTASGVIATGGLTALVGKVFYKAKSAGSRRSSVVGGQPRKDPRWLAPRSAEPMKD
jgi:hypothetical protein